MAVGYLAPAVAAGIMQLDLAWPPLCNWAQTGEHNTLDWEGERGAGRKGEAMGVLRVGKEEILERIK